MPGTLLLWLVWLGVVAFVLGSIARLLRYAIAPMHLRWDLYPVAHEPRRDHGGSYLEEKEWWTKPRRRSLWGEIVTMAEEIVLLRGVWANNRRVWAGSLPFHWGLYLMILTTVGLVGLAVGVIPTSVVVVLRPLGLLAGGLLALGALILLVLRTFDGKLTGYTAPLDRLNLLLLAALGVLSALVAAGRPGMALAAGAVAAALHFQPLTVPGVLAAQMTLAAVFLLYMPFTRMIHIFSKYFLYHEVRWDDAPRFEGSRMDRVLTSALDFGVSWSAPHVGSGRSWGEVATGPMPTETQKGS